MDFYTVVLRQSTSYWVVCLENGLVGQGKNQEDSIKQLKQAIDSFQEAYEAENNIYNAPISIEALHEFLLVEGIKLTSKEFELRAIHA